MSQNLILWILNVIVVRTQKSMVRCNSLFFLGFVSVVDIVIDSKIVVEKSVGCGVV